AIAGFGASGLFGHVLTGSPPESCGSASLGRCEQMQTNPLPRRCPPENAKQQLGVFPHKVSSSHLGGASRAPRGDAIEAMPGLNRVCVGKLEQTRRGFRGAA